MTTSLDERHRAQVPAENKIVVMFMALVVAVILLVVAIRATTHHEQPVPDYNCKDARFVLDHHIASRGINERTYAKHCL